ncbi:MAG: hypothetical protein ACREOJ_02635 [Gemmatimonadaceae bacterium]
MHFKFLSEVGQHYSTETTTHIMHTPMSSLRETALRGLAAGLLRAKTRYEKNLHDSGLHGKTVNLKIQARAAAFLGAAGNATTVTAAEMAESEAAYKSLLKHFQNQGGVLNRDGTLNWGASDQLVVYDATAASQDLTRVRIEGGIMYTDDAHLHKFDTSQLSTFFSKLGFAIYVMSEEGNLHSANHAIGYKHHSSLLAAANAAGAGEMKVVDGRLKWISNKSGHYAPSLPHFIQTLHLLQKKGVDLAAVALQFHSSAGKVDYATVADFLATLKGEDDYYHAKMIAYINSYPYGQIDMLVQGNGWRFPSSHEYNDLNMQGLVNTATGVVVQHKMVCQFFKLRGLACNPVVNAKLLQKGAGR